MAKVAIFGGGVAGMSAAQELIERGFDVEVYELRGIPGGKARSINVPDSAAPGKKPLPGEHGFRFFPGFYKNVTDTMKRIPYKNNPRGVFDNLVSVPYLALAQLNHNLTILPASFPHSCWDLLEDIELIIEAIVQNQIPKHELKFFAARTWQLMTSCQERFIGEYEKISWWDYVDAERMSKAYQDLLAQGLTTSLVASRPKLANTKTAGEIYIQLLFDFTRISGADRVLNGPTNDVWIDPWLEYLRAKGVKYYLRHRLRRIEVAKDDKGTMRVTGAIVTDLETKTDKQIAADYYLAAVPADMMAGLLSKEILKGDPALATIESLGTSTAWMNGIQFYLNRDVVDIKGHILYAGTPWSLTSISQQAVWKKEEFPMEGFGKGNVKGIISAIASDWGYFINPNNNEVGANPGSCSLYLGDDGNKPAQVASPDQIKKEIWDEMKNSLKKDGKPLLKDEDLLPHGWFLDPDITNSSELVDNPEKLEEVLNLYLPDSFKALFLWIHQHERDSVTLEEIANYLEIDQYGARLEVNALIAKGFVGPIPRPKDCPGASPTVSCTPPKPENETLCYYSRLRHDSSANINSEPLMVNVIDNWNLRPLSYSQIPNLFLASDYVRTNVDLATMEGANEAARYAVNSIIDASRTKVPYCKVWNLRQPIIYSLHRWSDRQRYQQGLPWSGKLPWYLKPLFPLVLFLGILEILLLQLWVWLQRLCPWLR
ncbi:MAG: FAD-dependent oxidoreductase [Roseofilum sp. Belize BBD 4]|nr:FAD-dependent oxidoreductase [Roseofilum sp. Belize Diploria]MBP0032854.1 FAD-dependent oxidoreductase [Roseofilum sp. Belize BBD 4]